MNWLTNFVKPKLSALVKRKDVPENLWQNCPKCGSMIHHKDLRENLNVCNSCNHHFRMSVEDRINLLFTKEDTIEIELDKIYLQIYTKIIVVKVQKLKLHTKDNKLIDH